MAILTLSLRDGATIRIDTRQVVAICSGVDGGAVVQITRRDIGTSASLHVMETPKAIMAMIEEPK
jgi:hypothetical protein